MKTIKPITLITLLCLTLIAIKPTEAFAWQKLAWSTLKELAIDTAIDAIQDLFKDKVTPQQVAALNQRVSELDTQLAIYKTQGNYPSQAEFNQIKQLLNNLDQIANTLTKRLSNVEDRVTALEQQIAQLRQILLNLPRNDKGLKSIQNDAPAPLDFQINYVYRSGGKGDFKTLTDNGVLHSNDYYKIIFTPAEDCYIYIFQVDSANKIYRLFPMKGFANVIVNNFNPVQGGQTYYIPAKNKSFVLDDQIGKETIYFVASRQNDVILEKQYQVMQLLQQQNKLALAQLTQRQLTQTMRNSKGLASIQQDISGIEQTKTTWQEDGQQFSVLQNQLKDLCNGCVNILSFSHK